MFANNTPKFETRLGTEVTYSLPHQLHVLEHAGKADVFVLSCYGVNLLNDVIEMKRAVAASKGQYLRVVRNCEITDDFMQVADIKPNTLFVFEHIFQSEVKDFVVAHAKQHGLQVLLVDNIHMSLQIAHESAADAGYIFSRFIDNPSVDVLFECLFHGLDSFNLGVKQSSDAENTEVKNVIGCNIYESGGGASQHTLAIYISKKVYHTLPCLYRPEPTTLDTLNARLHTAKISGLSIEEMGARTLEKNGLPIAIRRLDEVLLFLLTYEPNIALAILKTIDDIANKLEDCKFTIWSANGHVKICQNEGVLTGHSKRDMISDFIMSITRTENVLVFDIKKARKFAALSFVGQRYSCELNYNQL